MMLSATKAWPAVICAPVTVAMCPWFALTTPLTSCRVVGDGVGVGVGVGVGDGDVGDELVPPQPVMVIVTPTSSANTDSAVNSRREMAFPELILRNTSSPHES